MRINSFLWAVALVLSGTSLATASPTLYALGLNGTIYNVAADGSTSTFLAGQGGFCLTDDTSGNLYVDNTAWTLSKITPGGSESAYAFANGITPAIGVIIHGPNSLAFDSAGNLYSNNLADGSITVTGSGGSPISTFVSGLNTPHSLAVDSSGNLYASSSNAGLIYKITPAASVSTFVSGIGGAAGLAFDSAGNLYASLGSQIDKITPDGGVSTFISEQSFAFGALTFDKSNNLYVATQFDTIQKITPGGSVSTFATLPGGITDLVATPEPASIVLLGSAAGCLLLLLRRRRASVPR